MVQGKKISFLGISEVDENQWAQKKKERAEVSVNNGQVNTWTMNNRFFDYQPKVKAQMFFENILKIQQEKMIYRHPVTIKCGEAN